MGLRYSPDEDLIVPIPNWFFLYCWIQFLFKLPYLFVQMILWVLEKDKTLYQENKVLCIGHRGARKNNIPENSKLAFQFAYESGADGIELDTQATEDLKMVVFHDSTWDRTTNQKGKVSKTHSNQLPFILLNNQEPVSTLLETVQNWSGKMIINIEIKKEETPQRTKLTAKEVSYILKSQQAPVERIIGSSFSPLALYWFHKYSPLYPRAQLIATKTQSPYIGLKKYLMHSWFFAIALGTEGMVWEKSLALNNPHLVSLAKRLGFFVWVYTSNTPEEWKRLIEMGIHGIITDKPDELINYLKKN